MSKAGNVKKAARANTTSAARKTYGKAAKTPRSPRAPKGGVAETAAAAAAGAAAGAASTPAGKKAAREAAHASKPDYPPPPAVDHSAGATDTPPDAIDKKGQRVG